LISFQLTQADKPIAKSLELNTGDPIYEIKRVRLANNEPVPVETINTHQKIVANLQEQNLIPSFSTFIKDNFQFPIKHVDPVIESALANHVETKHLHLQKGDPVLLMHRITYLNNENETPFEYVRSAYRADKYKFKLQMNR